MYLMLGLRLSSDILRQIALLQAKNTTGHETKQVCMVIFCLAFRLPGMHGFALCLSFSLCYLPLSFDQRWQAGCDRDKMDCYCPLCLSFSVSLPLSLPSCRGNGLVLSLSYFAISVTLYCLSMSLITYLKKSMELYLVFVSSSVLFHFASLACCSRHEEDPDSIMDTCVGLDLTLTLTLVNRNITSPCKIVCVGLVRARSLSLPLSF